MLEEMRNLLDFIGTNSPKFTDSDFGLRASRRENEVSFEIWVCSVSCYTTKHFSLLTKLHKEQEECLVV